MADRINLPNGESGIVAYYESKDYWYVLTTRRVVVWEDAQISSMPVETIDGYDFGDFKGILTTRQTETMQLKNGERVIARFRYETGEESMGSIYGLITLLSVGKERSGNSA